MAPPRSRKADLPDALREIAIFDRSAGIARWMEKFDAAPPPYLSLRFLRRVLAQETQCRAFGDYTAGQRRSMRALVSGDGGSETQVDAGPGAVLLREWNGRTYRVEVKADSYVLDGEAYRSLSAVAKRITGANWSGPRFFGLKREAGG